MIDPILFNADYDFIWGNDYDWPDEEDTEPCRHCGGEGYFPGNNFGTFEMSYPDENCDECYGTGLANPPQYTYGPSYSLETEIELTELKDWAEREAYTIDLLEGQNKALNKARDRLVIECNELKEKVDEEREIKRRLIAQFKEEIEFAAHEIKKYEMILDNMVKNTSKILETQMAPIQIILGERKSEA